MAQRNSPTISIIIPVLNEQDHIDTLLTYLKPYCTFGAVKEILVVDGGSSDCTVGIVLGHGINVLQSKRGRAKQMNLAAKHAKGEILYFLHSDTFPPKNFDRSILDAITVKQQAGCFRMKFDSDSLFLKFFAWFSRLNFNICRGGDQSLFITKSLFQKTGGFNEDYLIYEDNEFIGRLYNKTHFTVLPQHVRTSARRYEEKGKVKLQYHFGMIHLKNYLGAGPEKLYDYYKRKIAI